MKQRAVLSYHGPTCPNGVSFDAETRVTYVLASGEKVNVFQDSEGDLVVYSDGPIAVAQRASNQVRITSAV